MTTEEKLQSVGAIVKVLTATIGVLNEELDVQDRRLRALEFQVAPVLWICPMQACGAPNETPRLVWDLMAQAVLPCVCRECGLYSIFDWIALYGGTA